MGYAGRWRVFQDCFTYPRYLDYGVPRFRILQGPSAMNTIAEGLLLLDAENDIEGMVRRVQDEGKDLTELTLAAFQLLVANHLRPAYLIAMLLANAGYRHPVTALALAVGGLSFGSAEEETRGLAILREQMEGMEARPQATFYTAVVEPVMRRILAAPLRSWDYDRMLRILEILRAGVPSLRALFDLDTTPPLLSLEGLRRRGRERSRILTYATPPASEPRRARRAVVAVRDLFFPNDPKSRPMDLGPRLVEAMDAYGWRTRYYGIACRNLITEYRDVAELCEAHEAEVLILDDNLIEAEYARPARVDMIARLRRMRPELKIVSILFDTWSLEPQLITGALSGVDCVWEMTSPSLPLWREPPFAGKTLHMQVPHAGNQSAPDKRLDGGMSFCGGVMGYNWNRAFWLAAAARLGLPIERRLSTHTADGLPALDSYANYMRQLAQSPCSLNLSMRSDLTRIVTGRCFETIISGSLLVQESTPDMDYYFTSGEHYLEFSTIAEFAAVARFLAENRDEAEEVRRCGNAFACERYSDDRLIGYLDKRLFFPD